MGERIIKWDKIALQHLQKALEFIAEQSPQAAETVTADVCNAVNKLVSHPELHPPDKFRKDNNGLYRAFEIHSLRVSYFTGENDIRILRIRHTKRKPRMY